VPARATVDRRRHLVAQRLVRALLVVDASKDVEFSLLRVEIIGDWSVRFEREVQALQTAILLRLTWLDSFEANAES
jgi:hypothetical protein